MLQPTPTTRATHTSEEIDPLYYLHNFNQLIESVCDNHADLLHEQDTQQLALYRAQPQAAQQLYVRLICRRAELFRRDKLNYPEIPDLDTAITTLVEAGLLELNPALSPDQLGTLTTAPELRKTLRAPSKLNKTQLISALRERLEEISQDQSKTEDTLFPTAVWHSVLPQQILCPLGGDTIERARLIYFGNLYQDLSEFVITYLGYTRYESYPLDRQTRPFQSKAEIDNYLALNRLHILLEETGTLDPTMLTTLIPTLLESHDNQRLEHKRNHLIHYLGKLLERQKNYAEAAMLYATGTLPPNRERHIRCLFQHTEYEQAKTHCIALQQTSMSVEEREFTNAFLPRIERKLGGPPVKAQKDQFPQQNLTLPNNGERVEMQVLAYYQRQGWQGSWCENNLFNALFALLFWREIYAPLPGAFSHPFQQAPLDFRHADFCRRRQTLFQTRLAALQHLQPSQLWPEVEHALNKHKETSNPFISWQRLDIPALQALCTQIPMKHLLKILDYFCFDIHGYRSGFPDLFLWRDAPSDYLLLEVKGPGDALQASQKRWCRIFDETGIQYSLCWVEWEI